jgi:hypothetical protein
MTSNLYFSTSLKNSKKSIMKKVYLICAAIAISGLVNAQTEANKTIAATPVAQPTPEVLVLSETEYNFGKIPQGKPVSHDFTVKNIGKDSLRLENVQASCGCTTPTWSKEPIAPGASATITVGYNAAAASPFEKYITIFYSGGKTKQYKIKGEVFATPAEPAPANKATSNLKN